VHLYHTFPLDVVLERVSLRKGTYPRRTIGIQEALA
jgi:hypothetical protein